MGLSIYGIGAAQCPDNVGETIIVDGMDLSRCRILSDEHGDDEGNLPAFRIIGSTTKTKVIHGEMDCDDEYQRRCWKVASVPFVYMEAELAGDDHPDAAAAAALIRFCQRPEIPLKVGLSVEGGIFKRGGPDDKTLLTSMASGFAFTVKPCNPRCQLFLKNDLAKSDASVPPPARYFEALRKSQATSSIIENPKLMLLYRLENLKKSLNDYMGAFTSLRCANCGTTHRFFKSGKLMNGCPKCGECFSLTELWRSLNK